MENSHGGDADTHANDTPAFSAVQIETEPETNHHSSVGVHNHDADDEAEVWQSFEQSVAYMRNLSDLYKDAFLTKKTTVPTMSHIHAAKEHAREVLELLASNLLNASTAIVATMENQEEHVADVDTKLERVKCRLRERQETRDKEAIRRFFDGADDRILKPSTKTPSAGIGAGSLKLTLAGPASASSSGASSYLYL